MSIRVQLSCKHKVIAEGIAAVLRTHADIHLVGVTDEDLGTKILCELERPEVVVVGVDPRNILVFSTTSLLLDALGDDLTGSSSSIVYHILSTNTPQNY